MINLMIHQLSTLESVQLNPTAVNLPVSPFGEVYVCAGEDRLVFVCTTNRSLFNGMSHWSLNQEKGLVEQDLLHRTYKCHLW